MVVDPGPDSFPHVGVRDDSLVSPHYQEDVDKDDLVAPVIFNPETQPTFNTDQVDSLWSLPSPT